MATSAPLLVQPDTAFLADVLASGGGDLKRCYQCATCSTVCELSPEDAPFPRTQMLRAQWGLKDQLIADPALWLCHNCGHCTERCPRGARPGDVIAALRQQVIQALAFPAFLGRALGNRKALPLLFLFPVLLFAAVAVIFGKPQEGEMEFAHVFPVPVLEAIFFAVSGFALLAFTISIVRYVKAVNPAAVLTGLFPAIREALRNERTADCDADLTWRRGHLLTLWGFLTLATVGTLIGIGSLVGLLRTPLPLTHPFKLLGNLGAAVIIAGVALLLAARRAKPRTTYFDWLFLFLLGSAALTGLFSELLRLAQTPVVMYAVYFVHLVLVFALLAYAPYSKFAHLAYRTVAAASREPWRPRRRAKWLTGVERERHNG